MTFDLRLHTNLPAVANAVSIINDAAEAIRAVPVTPQAAQHLYSPQYSRGHPGHHRHRGHRDLRTRCPQTRQASQQLTGGRKFTPGCRRQPLGPNHPPGCPAGPAGGDMSLFTGWAILGYTGLYWAILGYTGLYWAIRWAILGYRRWQTNR